MTLPWLITFVGLILIFNTKRLYLRYIYLLSVILNSIIIYLTATKGVILAALFGVIFFSLFIITGKLETPKERLLKNVALSMIGVIIISSLAFWSFRNTFTRYVGDTDFIQKEKPLFRLATMFSGSSTRSRLRHWRVAWDGFKKRPVLGWGQENFVSVYTINQVPNNENISIDRVHNIVLEWLVNAGLLGIFSYLAIFGFAFYVTWAAFRKNFIVKIEALTIITALVVYFVQNLFTFDTINTYLVFFTLLAYIDNLAYPGGTSYSEDNIKSKKLWLKSISVALAALLIFSFTAYFINYKPIRESQLTKHIFISSSSEKHKSFLTVLDDFHKALSYKTFGDPDVIRAMVSLSNEILRLKLFTQEGALQFVQATSEEAKKLLAFDRYNLKYWVSLIDLYSAIAFYEPSYIPKAEALIKQVSPEKEWLYLTLADNFIFKADNLILKADNLILKKDYESAFNALKKAEALRPENEKIQLKLALIGISTQRKDIVNSALDNVKNIRMSKDDVASGKKSIFSADELLVLAQASEEVKNFSQALQFHKEIISIFPGEAKRHFDIAKIYLSLGDKANALKEAEKAAELDPVNYSENAKKFINSFKNKP